MTDAFLECDNLSLRLEGRTVLRELTLRIAKNESVVILGESGCGKTVLLKLLIGLMQPTEGEVKVEGRSWKGLTETETVQQRQRFGFLFQGAALFDSLTVYDNVAFGLRARQSFTEAEIRKNVEERLKEVGLTMTIAMQKPAELSGGMKKRVGLARALALNPEVMLYDEPTTGLDPIMTEVINGLIRKTRESRPVTSIVVTHELKTVWAVANRVLLLSPLSKVEAEESQILFDGTVEELQQSQLERVKRFIGSS